jgi:glycine cleavage system aminomethyltransferase T
MSDLKRTVLYDRHVASGATMVDFGGWEMPIHQLMVKNKVNIFRVNYK